MNGCKIRNNPLPNYALGNGGCAVSFKKFSSYRRQAQRTVASPSGRFNCKTDRALIVPARASATCSKDFES